MFDSHDRVVVRHIILLTSSVSSGECSTWVHHPRGTRSRRHNIRTSSLWVRTTPRSDDRRFASARTHACWATSHSSPFIRTSCTTADEPNHRRLQGNRHSDPPVVSHRGSDRDDHRSSYAAPPLDWTLVARSPTAARHRFAQMIHGDPPLPALRRGPRGEGNECQLSDL